MSFIMAVIFFFNDALQHILKDQAAPPLISLKLSFIILCFDLSIQTFKASNIWKVYLDCGFKKVFTLTHRCPTGAHIFTTGTKSQTV